MADNSSADATVFSAFVAEASDTGRVQIQLRNNKKGKEWVYSVN